MRPEDFKPYILNKMKKALQQSMTAVAGEAVVYVKNRFTTQTDPDGQHWAPRKKNTKRNSGRAILVDTGRLSRNNRYENIRSTGFDITNRTPYASVHNYGGTITRNARSETFVRNRFKRGKKGGGLKKGLRLAVGSRSGVAASPCQSVHLLAAARPFEVYWYEKQKLKSCSE